MGLVTQSQGIDKFFDNLFGFMRRKTDLYTMPDRARGTVSTTLEKHILAFEQDKKMKAAIARKKEEERIKKEAEAKAKAEAEARLKA